MGCKSWFLLKKLPGSVWHRLPVHSPESFRKIVIKSIKRHAGLLKCLFAVWVSAIIRVIAGLGIPNRQGHRRFFGPILSHSDNFR